SESALRDRRRRRRALHRRATTGGGVPEAVRAARPARRRRRPARRGTGGGRLPSPVDRPRRSGAPGGLRRHGHGDRPRAHRPRPRRGGLRAGAQAGLRIYNPVDDDGRFVPEVEHFGGMTVWEANPRIIEHLARAGALVASVPLRHTYPHCWRCKNPTLFRATEQWFIALDKNGLRQKALHAIRHDVEWIPEWGEERIYNMVAHRPDWVLSRQRVWGVPIVAFYCRGCEALLLEERVIEHVAGIFRDGRGIEEWYLRAERELVPPATRCPKCGGQEWRRETDILDVWVDSGCSRGAAL